MAKPEIRLKGFKGEWENKLLGNLCSVNRGKRVTRKELSNQGEYPVFQNTDYPMGLYNQYNVAGNNPFVIIGGSAGLIGFSEKEFWAADDCVYFGDNAELDKVYLYNILLKHSSTIKKNVRGSSVPRLDRKVLVGLSISIPSIGEQQAIADYFKSMESMIQGVTKKIASLKQMKQACLVSMFPQAGESTPRVRFKGFNGEWKEVKFGSLIKECMDRSTTENEDILLSSSIEGMFLNSELFGHQRGRSNIGYRKIRKNMMILSAQNLHLGNANVNLRFEHGLVSPAYKIYDLIGCSPVFMYCWIKREETKKFFLDATTAGASLCRKNIVWNDLYNQKIFIPFINEQDKIGSFFYNLDIQISLQEARLEKLKQIKYDCLDKMFV